MVSDSAGYHDSRPRVHIWTSRCGKRVRWSIGPLGRRSQDYPSAGIALDAVIGHFGGHRPAVIIMEPAG